MTPDTDNGQAKSPETIARENWDRYKYAVQRGHADYTEQAARCEDMYMGQGRQWRQKDREYVESQRRPAYEFNEIKPALNAAIGDQINNRLDITFRPRGDGADNLKAEIRTKVMRQIADQTRLHWKETEVYADGLIQRRGYFDVRVDFSKNMRGNIVVSVLDPMDVIPDPDAKTYEPDGWTDVLVTRWLTKDDIAGLYGDAAAGRVGVQPIDDGRDFGEESDDEGAARSKFGSTDGARLWDAVYSSGGTKHWRVVERQRWVRKLSNCLLYPRTGDIKLADGFPPEVVAEHRAQGAEMIRIVRKRVRWTVSTADVLLHDEGSPYDGFTIIPFFPYFRRGKTGGLVDDAIGPQEALNKGISQFVHIINTSANSGWVVEQNSLANMTVDELKVQGAQTGLVLEYKRGAAKPEKIQPNQVPTGIDRLIDRSTVALRDATVPEAMRGLTGPETAGIAIQSKQSAAKTQLAVPRDNLSRTRHMLAERMNELVTKHYGDYRIFRITERDPTTGRPIDTPLEVNKFDPATGTYINDLTEGDYDVVISEAPASSTFQDGEFEHAVELRKIGVAIPDSVLVKSSALSRREEVIEEMRSAAADPAADAKAKLLGAQATKATAEAVSKLVETIYSATQAGNQIAQVPGVAPLADQILRSAGFQDADTPPIVPEVPPGAGSAGAPALPGPANTNPLTPANPAVGMNDGIERMDRPMPQ